MDCIRKLEELYMKCKADHMTLNTNVHEHIRHTCCSYDTEDIFEGMQEYVYEHVHNMHAAHMTRKINVRTHAGLRMPTYTHTLI